MASSSSYNSPCAACKFLRRKCMPGCIFAPYFPPEEPQKFANVHKIFGASNVSKLLNELLPHQRDDAVNSLAYEAEARVRDPVYDCVGAISFLQRQVDRLQKELDAPNADLIRFDTAPHAVEYGRRVGDGGGGIYQTPNSYGYPYHPLLFDPNMADDDAPPVAPAHPSPQDSETPPSASNPEFTMDSETPPSSSNKISDLMDEFKLLVQEALKNRIFLEAESAKLTGEVSIWGVPLLKDERSDVILLKFLRARDFVVKDAYVTLSNIMKWRRDFGVDELLKEDLGDDLKKVVFMHGYDKEGHPVCYNVYGEFQDKELYVKTFADEEKRLRFLRWRIQFLERSIRKLDFSPDGINTIFQVSDLKNSPGLWKKDFRIATKEALQILQDNYPEFVAKQVFINVPWWYLASYTMMSPFLIQRTKSKVVRAGPASTAETLFKYIWPEKVPIQYGGLSVDLCECNLEFTMDDPVTELSVEPVTKRIVEFTVNEICTLVWELRVVGWKVIYSAEFITQRGYTIVIQKSKEMGANDLPVVSDSFHVSELGKLLLTIENPTFKERKLLYRYKVVPSVA